MADINVNERKTPEKIKEKILEALNNKPLNAQEISKEINSNWSTVKNYVEELIIENKIKEIIATDKISYYQKITHTYYNIPITREQENLFKFLFSAIIQEYRKNNKLPRKTDLAKDSVDVINKLKLDLPTAWYIYGQIPLMIPDPTKEYLPENIPKNAEEIKKLISHIVKINNGMKVMERENNHYLEYNNKYYLLKNNLLNKIDLMKDEKEIINLLTEFYFACPISDYQEIFDLTDRFYLVVNKLEKINKFKEHKVDILLSLDVLWKFISSFLFLESLSKIPQYNKDDLLQFNLGSAIETKKYCAEENISNLESIYFSELPMGLNLELSKEALGIREIMSEWDGR
jgi:hypothetical protein